MKKKHATYTNGIQGRMPSKLEKMYKWSESFQQPCAYTLMFAEGSFVY